jgi:hypothetical protein
MFVVKTRQICRHTVFHTHHYRTAQQRKRLSPNPKGSPFFYNSITMYNSRIALMSRTFRLTAQAIQRPHAHARTIATVGPRAASSAAGPTTNPEAHHKKGRERNALYVGGGLVGIGAIWYYYAMAESARLAKEQEGLAPGRARSVEDTKRSDKERAQELIKGGDAKYQDVKAGAQSKVQAGKDQVAQSVERGKQRFDEGLDQAARRAAEAQATTGQQSCGSIVSLLAH